MAARPAARRCNPPGARPGRAALRRAAVRARSAVLVGALALVLTGAARAAPPAAPAAESAAASAVRPPAGQAPSGDPLVARVNGHEMRLSEVYASIESLSLGDQIDARDQLETYIEALINEEVLFQWALRTDFADSGALRQEVKEVVVRHLIDRHVRSRLRVSEADAKAYYDANPSLVRGEHVRVRRILLPERARCEALKAQIGSEEEFIAAARKHSLDERTRESGGDVGLMMRGENPPQSYEQEFFAMQRGEMRIFDVPRGCMLVRSVFYVNPPLPPFAAVREQIMAYLRDRQEVALVERLFREAGQGMQVERFYRDASPGSSGRARAAGRPERPGSAAGTGPAGGTSR